MIRFTCPTCQRFYECPNVSAGYKIDCFCGQRVQIPPPAPVVVPIPHTVLGKPDGSGVAESLSPSQGTNLPLGGALSAGELPFATPIPQPPPVPLGESSIPSQCQEQSPPAKSRAWVYWALAAVGVALALTVILCVSSQEARFALLIGLFSIALLGGIAFLIVALIGYSYACPECGKWWARLFVRSKIVDQRRCHGLVTRYGSTHSSGTYSNGRTGGTVSSSGTSSWQERVPVIRTTYRHFYECKFCVAKWTETTTEETEDFER